MVSTTLIQREIFSTLFLPLSNFVRQNDTNIPIETSDCNTKTDVNNQRQPNDRWHWHDDTLSGIWQFFFFVFFYFCTWVSCLGLVPSSFTIRFFWFFRFFSDFNRFVFLFLFRLFPDDSISIHTCFSILGNLFGLTRFFVILIPFYDLFNI